MRLPLLFRDEAANARLFSATQKSRRQNFHAMFALTALSRDTKKRFAE
jgi:hypothetical protein